MLITKLKMKILPIFFIILIATNVVAFGETCPETSPTCAVETALACPVNQTAGAEKPCVTYGTGFCNGTVNVLFFYQTGCLHCEVVEYFLKDLESRCNNLKIIRLEVGSDENNRDVFLKYTQERGLKTVTPIVVVGNTSLVGEKEMKDNIEGIVKECSEECHPCIAINGTYIESEPPEGGVLSLVAVVSTGFIDGVNPCAFAVMIFFVSYLTAVGRSKRTILLSGMAYITAVFFTYLGLGIGVMGAIRTLNIQQYLPIPVALFTLLVGFLSLYDAYTSRKKPSDMVIKMPSKLRGLVNKVIRENVRSRYIIGVSVLLGVLVASFELPCTGEVYLPILSILSHKGVLVALPFLAVYNFMFVLPLFGLFALIYQGTDSQRVAQFVMRHTPLMKLLVGILLILLAFYLLWVNKLTP